MSETVLRGTAWVATGYVMAYEIITQEHWTSRIDPVENAKFVMAGSHRSSRTKGPSSPRDIGSLLPDTTSQGAGKASSM